MPSSKNYKRNYKHEYAIESPQRRQARADRNKARRIAAAFYGKAAIEGKDVGHRKAIGRGGKTVISNIFPQSAGENRSFARKPDGSMASEVSKRERKKRKAK